MSSFVSSISTAAMLFPLIALIITAPFMVFKYRKIGSVPFSHALIIYSFVFYLMCAYFLVLLPLPADRTAVVPYAQTPQLVPFRFVQEIAQSTNASLTNPATWPSFFCSPAVYGVFFNILLLLPLGVYLRYYFHRSWQQTLIIGFLVSLSFELTQLTGDWGLYAHPYRLFDVDDLMTNTLGAMIGFWLAGPITKALPDTRLIAREAKLRGRWASVTRRALSFVLDYVLSQLIAAAIYIGLRSTADDAALSGIGVSHTLFWISQLAGLLLVFVVFVLATHGRTPAQMLTRLRIVRPDGTDARWWQLALRYVLLFAICLIPIWMFSLSIYLADEALGPGGFKNASPDAVNGAIALLAVWAAGVIAWLITLAVRAWRSARHKIGFVMLNGLISGTRVMTEDGIADLRARMRVLDVADVVALEQKIAAEGTPLDELMRRAGSAVAGEVRAWVPDPAPVVILAGSGNNGGDGWVCARDLARDGYPVTLVTPRIHESITAQPAHDEAAETVRFCDAENLPLRVLVNPDEDVLAEALDKAAAVVDAILGTGFSGNEVRDPYALWIELANRRRYSGKASHVGRGTHAKRAGAGEHIRNGLSTKRANRRAKATNAPFALAVDTPSGLSAQTGEVAQPSFHADETITMLAYKPGLIAENSKRLTGHIELAELV